MVGVRRLELPAFRPPDERANQTAPHPEAIADQRHLELYQPAQLIASAKFRVFAVSRQRGARPRLWFFTGLHIILACRKERSTRASFDVEGVEDTVHNIIYSKQAVKALNGMDAATKHRIKQGIEKIPEGDIVPLQGSADGRKRLRVGKYRVVFNIVREDLWILEIGARGDICK